jgi:hypothetical protein
MTVARPDPHIALCRARRDMLKAFVDWLNTHPSQAKIVEEVDATMAAVVGIVAILGEGNMPPDNAAIARVDA